MDASDISPRLLKRTVIRSASPHAFGSAFGSAFDRVGTVSSSRPTVENTRLVCHHGHTRGFFCIAGALKGFAYGCVGWVALLSCWKRRLSGWKRGIALGSFIGAFRAAQCVLLRWVERNEKMGGMSLWVELVKRFSPLFSGFASGAIFSAMDSELRSAVFVLWLGIRAFRSLEFLPSFAHTDLVLMIFGAGGILSTYVVRPEDHAPSYRKFLFHHGGKPPAIREAWHELKDDPRNTRDQVCTTMHPGQSCTSHFLTFAFDGFWRALPLYVPVHLAGLALSRKHSLAMFLENLIRSSLFLGTYCASAWYSACLFYKNNPFVDTVNRRNLNLALAIAPGISGWAVLFERPSRRRELANYCLTHCLNAYWNWFKRSTGFQPREQYSVLLLACSFAVLLYREQQTPNAIVSTILGMRVHEVDDTPSQ